MDHGFELYPRPQPESQLTESERVRLVSDALRERLDPDQAAVVGLPFNAVAAVLANAGSGKTFAVTARLLRYIAEGGDPSSIYCSTFTRFAATTIKARYADSLGIDPLQKGVRRRWPAIGNGHALAMRMLGRDMGLTFAPLAAAQVKQLIQSMPTYQRVKPEDYRDVRAALDSLSSRGEAALIAWPEFERNGRLRKVHNVPAAVARRDPSLIRNEEFLSQYRQATWFSERAIQARLTGKPMPATHLIREQAIDMHSRIAGLDPVDFVTFLVEYQTAKLRYSTLDFTDMQSVPFLLMLQHEHLCERVQLRYRAFLIDEAQDLSAADFALICMVAGFPEYSRNWPDGRSFVMVGDSKQSLYWWRNGLPLVLDNLDRYLDYPQAVFRGLTRNFRSAHDLVEASNAFSTTFDRRNNFESVAVRPNTEMTKIEVVKFALTTHEDAALIKRLLELHATGIPWASCAVLLRRNRDLDQIQAGLIAAGIPYRMRSMRANRRLTASEAFAFISALLSLTLNGRNLLAVPALALGLHGIGPKSLASLHAVLERVLGGDLLTTVEEAVKTVVSKSAFNVHQLLQIVAPQFRLFLSGQPLSETLKALEMELTTKCQWPDVEGSAGVRMSLELKPTLRVLQMLGDVFATLEEDGDFQALGPTAQLHQICANLALAEDPDAEGSTADGLMLSTVHSFKGGEARCVFLPRQTRSTPVAAADADGERCIFNVGITRAEEMLYISYSEKVMVNERWRKGVLSPYLLDFEATWDFRRRQRLGAQIAAE